MNEPTTFEQWAILELMGHVKLAGLVTEEEHFGAKLGRIDIPNGDGFTTQYFNGASIYRLTPTTEPIARSVAMRNQPSPVHRWELPAPTSDSTFTPFGAQSSDEGEGDEWDEDRRPDDEEG